MAFTERYVRADAAGGGGGTADNTTDAWTLAEAITNAASGQRINIRAGTYANTTTTRTFANAGTTTAPIWWRGFNEAIGDIDSNNALTKPVVTFTTGQCVVSGAHQIFSNLDIRSENINGTNPGAVRVTGGNITIYRCRIENTAANSNSNAVNMATSGTNHIIGCWLKCTSSANVLTTLVAGRYIGNVFVGGSIGLNIANGSTVAAFNVFSDNGSHGISAGAELSAINNTIWSAGGDGIRVTAASIVCLLANNLITESAGYGINQSSGGDTNLIRLIGNAYRSNTSGNVNGISEASVGLDFLASSLGSDPFVNAAGGVFSLVDAAKALGFPGAFENVSYSGYIDPGAAQRQEPAGGGAIIVPQLGYTGMGVS